MGWRPVRGISMTRVLAVLMWTTLLGCVRVSFSVKVVEEETPLTGSYKDAMTGMYVVGWICGVVSVPASPGALARGDETGAVVWLSPMLRHCRSCWCTAYPLIGSHTVSNPRGTLAGLCHTDRGLFQRAAVHHVAERQRKFASMSRKLRHFGRFAVFWLFWKGGPALLWLMSKRGGCPVDVSFCSLA